MEDNILTQIAQAIQSGSMTEAQAYQALIQQGYAEEDAAQIVDQATQQSTELPQASSGGEYLNGGNIMDALQKINSPEEREDKGIFNVVKGLQGIGGIFSGMEKPKQDITNGIEKVTSSLTGGAGNLKNIEGLGGLAEMLPQIMAFLQDGGETMKKYDGGGPINLPTNPNSLDELTKFFKTTTPTIEQPIVDQQYTGTTSPFIKEGSAPDYSSFMDQTKNVLGDGKGSKMASQILSGMGMLTDAIGSGQTETKHRKQMYNANNTDAFGTTQLQNPFGIHTVNDQMYKGLVPNKGSIQDTGTTMADGGEYEEGGEYMLTKEQIEEILRNGGDVEYID